MILTFGDTNVISAPSLDHSVSQPLSLLTWADELLGISEPAIVVPSFDVSDAAAVGACVTSLEFDAGVLLGGGTSAGVVSRGGVGDASVGAFVVGSVETAGDIVGCGVGFKELD